MSRIPELTPKYVAAVRRLGIHAGTPRAISLARELRRLAAADELPGPADVEAVIPPTSRAYVRRVADENLWIWWRIEGAKLRLLTLTALPPVPVED